MAANRVQARRLQTLFLDSPVGMAFSALDGTVLDVNSALCEMLGRSRDEVVRSHWRAIIHPDDRSDSAVNQQALEQGIAHRLRVQRRFIRPDGTVLWGDASAQLVRDADGRPDHVQVVVVDITDRKLAEEAHDRLAAIVQSSFDAIIGAGTDGLITSWNPSAEHIFGYTAEEMIGGDGRNLLPPWDSQLGGGMLPRVLAGERIEQHHLRRVRKDGTLLSVSVTSSPVRDSTGTIHGVASVIRDLSEQERAERQAAIIAYSTDAIVSTSLDGVVTSWNRGAEQLYGWTHAEMIGRSLDVVLPPERRAEAAGLRAAAARGDALPEFSSERIAKAGHTVHVSVTASPVTGFDGSVIGVSTIARDITARVVAEREREAIERRLQRSERLQSLGQLAGGVAHDFNNLLAVILNYAQFVAEAVEGDTRRDVEEILKAAERAARLTKQLLIFGRQDRVESEVLDLDAVVADMRTLLTRTLGEHVTLVVRSAEQTPLIRADRGRVEQVVVNLAVNARDAMPDGGTLTIETGALIVDSGAPTQAELRPGTYARLLVSDTGSGMSDDVIAHAFEPFYTTKPQGLGTGLGLATVYGIVSAAGGHVGIYSEGQLGTTVRVHLPAAEGVAASLQPPRATPPEGHGEAILVVEDDDAVRAVTARMLRRHGYVVVEAAGAEEAFTLVESSDIRLLLTDVLMPHMSGREVAERIRAQRPELPVVFMSGYSRGVLSPSQELEPGMTLLQKPFDEPTLLACVHAAIHPG